MQKNTDNKPSDIQVVANEFGKRERERERERARGHHINISEI